MVISISIRRLWTHFLNDSLFRNSVYLILATGVMAGFGFFFWLINAHYFHADNIGLATTLISVMNMIAILSLIGFDTAFVRFLPNSNQKSDKINTGIILVTLMSTVLSVAFLVFVGSIAPKLLFVMENPVYAVIFVLACSMNAVNVLTDAVFLAERQTKFSLIINFIFSVIKVMAPFAFLNLGAMGIFLAAALAQTVGMVLSLGVMIWKFEFQPRLKVNFEVIKAVWRFSVTNYVAGAFNLLPVTLLPILILNNISSEASAYYYIVMMIGNLLYTIPWSATKVLLAEGSHNENEFSKSILYTVRVIVVLLIPAVLVYLLGGHELLRFFGKDYDQGGVLFLYLITFTVFPISLYSIFNSYFRVKKLLWPILASNVFYALSIIGLSYYLLSSGLTGIGWAWFIGNVFTALLSLTIYRITRT